ncbi:MAG: hypothetical protein A2946_01270 [Candidatus Liptonbacteria bacterium RIFCSPLOWO2_01_FULL_53_13]|uniref:Uncharacterized protein n=1 Tax=Candidatus Liptonbacteria bacterium RIFCSPLOWO2_01_FULL_53_13 TaxID=1798651 RepID=A0A1G2CMV5_9BACT|nr:MAG: hypothetical protein A2946_01270 [Candidatus Liptonbacteria bacterium RIFCSPLOWO2_01_FULL_53_13]
MKFPSVILLIASVAGVMIFGAFLMLHSGGIDGHGICLPGLIDLRDCAPGISPFEYVGMHMGALNGLIAPPVPATALLLFAAIFMMLAFRAADLADTRNSEFTLLRPARAYDAPRVRQKLLRWFAIREKRDPSGHSLR